MKNLKHIWLIAMKDLKIFIQDRGSLIGYIAFPFLFIVMFSFILKGVGGGDQRLELHLLTREPAGGLSYQIIGAMETENATLLQPGQPIIVWDKDYDAAREAVEDKKLAGFIAFPADFTQSLMEGSPTELEVFADAGNVNTRTALNGMANAISSQIGGNVVVIKASVALLVESGRLPPDEASINRLIEEMMGKMLAGGGEESLITFEPEKVGEVVAENPSNYVVPGYLVMFVFMTAADMTARMIVRERQNRTLERLLSTSVGKASILGGMFTGSAIRGIIQIIIFWTVGILAFNVDMGRSPAAVIILSILMVLISSAFGVMLATYARTERSAGALGSITSLVLAPLGGCWWPLFLYPQWLQNIAKISPHAWAVEGFNKIMLFGADFGAAVPSMLALVGFGVIFGVIAVWRFRTAAV
jgi:ABC-2 type transport system permease protein